MIKSMIQHEHHVSKFIGPNGLVWSVGSLVCFGLALFFFMISWFSGGNGYINTLGGQTTLLVLMVGMVLSVIMVVIEKKKR
ncbi:MAG: hypothetical protein HKM02_01205 [Pseudomonadales bacterium]|nr:hypothetical protein [Pseudomonadales bacterium]